VKLVKVRLETDHTSDTLAEEDTPEDEEDEEDERPRETEQTHSQTQDINDEEETCDAEDPPDDLQQEDSQEDEDDGVPQGTPLGPFLVLPEAPVRSPDVTLSGGEDVPAFSRYKLIRLWLPAADLLLVSLRWYQSIPGIRMFSCICYHQGDWAV
jgi:hypothetical protein